MYCVKIPCSKTSDFQREFYQSSRDRIVTETSLKSKSLRKRFQNLKPKVPHKNLTTIKRVKAANLKETESVGTLTASVKLSKIVADFFSSFEAYLRPA